MMANMAASLILHKRIKTTTAKAKALRSFVEPIITKSKDDSTHSRRVVFSYLQDKEAVSELFREISPKIADRPGGYTRILKTGTRLGDNADMCIIELVDYNENLLSAKEESTKSSRRRRRGGGKKKTEGEVETAATSEVSETPVEEAVTESSETAEASEETEAKAEAPVEEEKSEEVKAEAPAEAKEEVKEEPKEEPAAEVKEEVVEEKKEEKKEEEVKAEAKTEEAEEKPAEEKKTDAEEKKDE
jgi:large subunit ribosomal protein L17